MRRKDILIIASVLIIIAFGAVFAIYYGINGGNIFSKVKEEIVELAESKGEYHSNGWETAIVDKIKYDIPIPVGFSYVEGDREKGLIIKDNATDEKYMWIPYQEVLEVEKYEKIILNENLEDATSENIESVQKYGGFFVAIDDRTDEERFEEYLKENAKDFEEYKQLKELGYEGYKNVYKEVTGEEFNLNSLENIIVDDSTKLDNYSKTSITETHTATKDELISIISYNNKIGNKIKLDNLKTLTVTISSDKDEYPTSVNGTKKMLKDYQKRIENAIEYVTVNTNYSEKKVKVKLGDDYEELLDFEVTRVPKHYNEVQELFLNISDILVEEFNLNTKQEKQLIEILEKQEKVLEINETVCEKYEDENGDIAYIPNGFDYESGTVKTGFKIKNTDNLSFIWIPVEDIESIKTEFVNNAKQANLNDSIIEAYEEYEDDTDNTEYKNLVDSIEMYGGFYISEAELGYDKNGNVINKYRNMIEKWGEGTGYNYVSNGDYYRNVQESNIDKDSEGKITLLGEKQSNFKLTYENAVNVCKDLFADSETVVSHLTYGIEYDAVVNYLIDTGVLNITEAFKDSSKIGKYKGTETIKSAWETELYLNGIYGLAGNLEEITQEKDGENIILRGGSWYTSGTTALASKIYLEEKEIDKGQDSEGNEILLGSVGFRTCLYIKTEYEKNEDLDRKKEEAKKEVRNYINDTIIKVNNSDVNLFNNKINETTNLYENPALNDIVKYIDERIDEETSSTSFNKITQYGKDEVKKLVDNIVEMINYKNYNEELVGWNEKSTAITRMQTLSWDKGKLKTEDGKETSYAEIRKKAEKDIDTLVSSYVEQKITEWIDNYPTASDKAYTAKIKERAKEEMRYTNDLGNLESIAIKYQGIIEVANSFDWTEPNTWDYYESWKNDYASLKETYLNKIANEAKTKEEAEAIAKEGMEKINAKAAEVIAKKKAEEAAAQKPTKPTDPTELESITLKVGDKKGGEIGGKAVSSSWKSEDDSIAKVEKQDDRYYIVGVKKGTTKINIGSTKEYVTVKVEDKGSECPACKGKEADCDYTAWNKAGTYRYALKQLEEAGMINSCGVMNEKGELLGKGCVGGTGSKKLYFTANAIKNDSYAFISTGDDGWFITRKVISETGDEDTIKDARDTLWTKLTASSKTKKYIEHVEIPTSDKLDILWKIKNNYGISIENETFDDGFEYVQESGNKNQFDAYAAQSKNRDNWCILHDLKPGYRLMVQIDKAGK